MIFFLRSYDNRYIMIRKSIDWTIRNVFETLSLYCFNKSKIIFEGLFLQKYGCLKNIDNFL